jgi:hypothetical protein
VGTTDLTRRDHGVTFDRETTDEHEFHLQPFRGFALEVEDEHFHHDSAVLLPNYGAVERDVDSSLGLSVLIACLKHQRGNPKQSMLIAGHADTSGPDQYNVGISLKRAQAVLHAIMGEKEPWVAIAKGQHKTEDYQLILTWVADTRDWDCDPDGVDNVDGPHTKAAVNNFQTTFNEQFDANIATDGVVGHDTWGAIFDVYMDTLKTLARTDANGLATLRSTMNFLGPKVVGCGENWPIEALQKQNYRSRINRRIEILFFDPGQEPTLDCHPGGSKCTPLLCEIYNLKMYKFTPLPAPILLPNTIHLTLDSPWFVPEAEELMVGYTITGPLDQLKSVRMKVVADDDEGTTLFEKELPSNVASGTFPWKGDVAPETWKGFVTLKHSPYRVQLFLETEFGVTIQSNIGKVEVLPKDLKIRVDDLPVAKVPADQQKAIADFKKEASASSKAKLVLVSPVFKVSSAEMNDDSSCIEYKNFEGNGPDVPLFAKVFLKGKDGSAKRSVKALHETKVLWDVTMDSDRDFTAELDSRSVHSFAKDFITKASAFKKDASEPPGSNCHVRLEGLRGTDAERKDKQWQSMTASWPLSIPSARKWDGHSDCAEEAGVDDDTGVFFAGGRMAGDSYWIQAFINHDLSLDDKDNGKLDKAPPERKSTKLRWTIWRYVEVTKSYKIGAGTTELDFPALDKEYNQAAMFLKPGPGLKTEEIQAKWKTEYKGVLKNEFAADKFIQDSALDDPEDWPVRYRTFVDYWEHTHPGAGFFGKLWNRIHSFFGSADKDTYLKQCDKTVYRIYSTVAEKFPLGSNGLTLFKFPNNGEHNLENRGSYTAGIAPALSTADRHKQAFLMFEEGAGTKTLIHEVGHLLFLAHAPGHFDPPKQPDGYQLNAHDQNALDKKEFCIMSYHSSKKHLCGLCQLKLRGWLYSAVKNDATVT